MNTLIKTTFCLNEIFIQFQIVQEIALFFYFDNFKDIALTNISLWTVVLWWLTFLYKHIEIFRNI